MKPIFLLILSTLSFSAYGRNQSATVSSGSQSGSETQFACFVEDATRLSACLLWDDKHAQLSILEGRGVLSYIAKPQQEGWDLWTEDGAGSCGSAVSKDMETLVVKTCDSETEHVFKRNRSEYISKDKKYFAVADLEDNQNRSVSVIARSFNAFPSVDRLYLEATKQEWVYDASGIQMLQPCGTATFKEDELVIGGTCLGHGEFIGKE